MPTLVSDMFTLTNSASGSKKNPQDRITIGRPAMMRITPVAVMPRL